MSYWSLRMKGFLDGRVMAAESRIPFASSGPDPTTMPKRVTRSGKL